MGHNEVFSPMKLSKLLALMLLVPAVAQAASAAEVSLAVAQQTSVPTSASQQQRPATKMQGYRIQIYSGVRGRESKNKAYQAGETCHNLFPELPVYCGYKEPRWNCRVGDFATLEEAKRCRDSLRESGAFSECSIVRSTIKYVAPEEPDLVDSILRRWLGGGDTTN